MGPSISESVPAFADGGLRALLDHGYEVTLIKHPRGGYHVSLTGPLGSYSTGLGDSPADALASVSPLGDDQADDNDEPYCYACGSPVGVFHGHGDMWHHWRGKGTAESPVELYDADHAPEVAWRPAGMR
jgi:hypothetical protein